MKNNFLDENGYYGRFGGAYVPEILQKNISELKGQYLKIMNDPKFKAELNRLLHHYVGRPTPLYYASRLSELYGTHIYLKREDLCHTGAHKLNNALGQLMLAKRMGKTRIVAETGAGQHGVGTATVCALMNMECVIYMGATDVKRQYLNVQRMRMLGAKVIPVTTGNGTLKDATNEAMRDWCCNPIDTYYIIGSVVGPDPYPDMVARFQSVISEEITKQLKKQTGREAPDYLIACVGGGSNAAGTFFKYLENEKVKLYVAEAAGFGLDYPLQSAATIHLGREGVLHGSKTMVMMDGDGQIAEAFSISAGLDYPGIGPLHAYLAETGRSKVFAITDSEAMSAALTLTQKEGIIPAIESAHALAVLDKCRFKSSDVVVITVSGRGDKDMNTFAEYFHL
ncbi:MAG: tryptophan synthase subunit beta [Bacteroidia bacterium]|nr:tryptophan synthase subunit beta [Bacteroidia bacterium]